MRKTRQLHGCGLIKRKLEPSKRRTQLKEAHGNNFVDWLNLLRQKNVSKREVDLTHDGNQARVIAVRLWRWNYHKHSSVITAAVEMYISTNVGLFFFTEFSWRRKLYMHLTVFCYSYILYFAQNNVSLKRKTRWKFSLLHWKYQTSS